MDKEKVSAKFWKWINKWADLDKHPESMNKNYTEGYRQACRDIFDKIEEKEKKHE